MIPKLESVQYVAGYRIYLRFADGRHGEIDLAQELWGEVFEPLRDPALFRGFSLNRELNTITWPATGLKLKRFAGVLPRAID